MSAKTPAPAFEIFFDGEGLYPEKIPWSALSRSLSAVQRMAAGEATERDEDEPEVGTEKNTIRLLSVKRGSARFLCVASKPESAVEHLRLVGAVLNNPSRAEQADYVFNSIEDLSTVAKSLGCKITLRDPTTKGVYATIEPDSYDRIATSMFVEGDATFAGKVVRVGGATRTRCLLRVDFQQRLMYCRVDNAKIARKMGQHLYEEVVAEGRASFLRTSWRIVRFTVTNMYQEKKGALLKNLQAIHELGGNSWNDVDDPKKYLEEVSGES